jgi:hypothetical protein
MTMHNYHIGDLVSRDYTVIPMPEVLRHRLGARIPINDENGEMIAMGEVLETTADSYKLRIIVTYNHRRGPSEFK